MSLFYLPIILLKRVPSVKRLSKLFWRTRLTASSRSFEVCRSLAKAERASHSFATLGFGAPLQVRWQQAAGVRGGSGDPRPQPGRACVAHRRSAALLLLCISVVAIVTSLPARGSFPPRRDGRRHHRNSELDFMERSSRSAERS